MYMILPARTASTPRAMARWPLPVPGDQSRCVTLPTNHLTTVQGELEGDVLVLPALGWEVLRLGEEYGEPSSPRSEAII